jgi:hypothetical protein
MMVHAPPKIGLRRLVPRAHHEVILADAGDQFFNIVRVVLSVRVKNEDQFAGCVPFPLL